MMSADDEILQRAQPKGFKSSAGLSPDTPTKKKFSLRRVTPDKNESVSSPTSVTNKRLFGGRRGNNSGSGNKNNGRGRRGLRSIEQQQKMQDEYYEGYDDDDDDNMLNRVEEEELDDGELPSLSPLAARGSRTPKAAGSGFWSQMDNSNDDSLASNSGINTKIPPTSERDYETLKVAGFWSQLDTGNGDSSDSDDDRRKPKAKAVRAQEEEEEEMPNDEGQWRRSQSPSRSRAADAENSNPMGLSLLQNTSTESTVRTEINKQNTDDDNDEANENGNATAAAGGWNLLEMARCFAADHRLTEENDAEEDQGLDQSYNPNARVVSPNNGRDTPFSNGDTTFEEEEEEGIIENICVQLGNICGFGGDDETAANKARAHDIIRRRRQRLGLSDDGDSVFEDLDGQEDVAIELGYVEPETEAANVASPKKKKKKGWKSFLGIKKKSPPRKTLVTETTVSGRDPLDGDATTKTSASDLEVANTDSGLSGLNPLDALGAAALGAAAAGAVASRKYDDDEELESQAAGWDAKRKNMYLRQLASQAKAQQSNSTEEEEEDEDEQDDTSIDRQDTPEAYTADYNNFDPSDKSKFLRLINGGMSPQDATLAVIQERDALAAGDEDYVTDRTDEGPRTRSAQFPDDEGGASDKDGDFSARDEDDLQGLVEELENQPVSESEMGRDSKSTPLETYQDRAVIPMVPAIVSTKSKEKSRKSQKVAAHEEHQNGLIPSGIQYYDAVPDGRNDDEVDYDDSSNAVKKRSQFGKPRLSKPNISSSIANSLSKRFDSAGKNRNKYGKVAENPSSLEEEDNIAPPVPIVVSTPAPVEEKVESREVEPAINEQSADGDEVSFSKPKTISFDLMQRRKRKNFSKLESDAEFALPAVSAKSDEEDLPSWAQSASKDNETVTSAFSPPIENMDDAQAEEEEDNQAEETVASTEQVEDEDATPIQDDEISATEYDEDTMSLMGQTFMTGASGYSRRKRRHKGAASTRLASAKEAENQAGAKTKGWIGSVQEVASKNGQVWHPEKGWMDYSEAEEENVSRRSLPPQAQADVVGFSSPRSIAGTEFDDRSVVTKLTVNTAAESPSILTTSTAPTRRAGRKPLPTDQRKIAAAHADKPIGWKDSMQNATNGVDKDGFRWDYEKGWIRIDGTSINDDEASALTESVFYNEGQDADQSPAKSELLPVTEEDADEFSDDDEDVFNNVDQSRGVNTMSTNEQGVSTKTVDYDEKYGIYQVESNDSSEKENSPANKVSESADDISEEKSTKVPERTNPLLSRIMAAEPEELPVFSEAVEEEEEQSAEVITREPPRSTQFIALADEPSEAESRSASLDPSGVRASQVNNNQEDPSGKTGASSSADPSPVPVAPKKSLNTWLESSEKATPNSLSDTNASHLQEESVDAVKTAEPSTKADSFNLESFEDGGDVFASTQVVKEKFSDTESDLFQPFEDEIKKAKFESFESQGSADNDWVSTTLSRQSPVTTSDEVSQKARVWMDSMQKDGETEESSESGSNEPQVNKADPPQMMDPPSAIVDTRTKKRPANSWIKAKNDGDEENAQKEARSLPAVESNVGSLRSKFESKKISAVGEEEVENDVVFHSQAMGIRLKRGEDGFVRVVSVTQATLGSSIERVGAIEPGDSIKEAAGIDLRSPITNSQWGEAVTQIRHAPRPMTFVVAAGPERKSKQVPSKPANSPALPPSQMTGGQSVVEYDLAKGSDGEQVLKSVKEYRRHYSPERHDMATPNRKKYGSPDRDSPYRSDDDSHDRTYYSEASSVYSDDHPTKDSFFNRIAACATAGAAACAPGGTQRNSSDNEESQVPMAHLKFLRTNPTITRVTNAAKNRLNCGRPDTIFEEPSVGPSHDLGRSKSAVSADDEARGDNQSRVSSVRAVPIKTTGDNTAFLENLAMKSAVSSNQYESKTEDMPPKPQLMVQSYLSGGGEVGWPEDNDQEFTWKKDTIDNVSTMSAHSAKKKESARQAEMLASAKVKAMMEDLDHDEDSECEI